MVRMVDTGTPTKANQRWRIHITGTVQGVGFRPFVARLARALQLTGWVCNDATGVLIEIQGNSLTRFVDIVTHNPPPLARVEQVNVVEISAVNISAYSQCSSFQILSSQKGNNQTKISSDTAICQHCLQELFDSRSRFYHYPFINCSDCGPRYTLTTALPYDRHQTSMATFPLCAACLKDYQHPDNRRYSTESIACPECGPVYSMPIAEMAAAINDGEILAIKGFGGYQLICDAQQTATVQKLRQRKARPDKPFALMALNIASAANIVNIDKLAAELLTSAARPIVVLPKKLSDLPELVAPNLADLGVMLPSTALHHLLFFYLLGSPTGNDWLAKPSTALLIVTSGNDRGEPLIKDDDIAAEKLSLIADQVVSHSRDIVTHADDSVVMLTKNKPVLVRRARGFVPEPILLDCELGCDAPPILGLGGDLKNTLCITRGREAFVSQHIGNLNNAASRRCYQETLAHMLTILNVKPEYIAHDCHPDFYTSQIASQFAAPTYAIQHHHAHLAAVAAEHHLKVPALGLALDGFGLGEHQQNWGGELFFYEGVTAKRIASLRPLPQPGGDQVTRQPWRMAVSALYSMGLKKEINQRFSSLPQCQPLVALLEHQVHCSLSSSGGRLFDAASAILGVCWHSSYEGQAAMQLEALVTQPEVLPDGWLIQNKQLDLLPTLRYLLDCDPITGANIFHGTLAAALTDWVIQHANRYQLNSILLGGGCFLNRVLVNLLTAHLTKAGLVPLFSKQLTPDDAGLCLGQAWAAAQNIISSKTGQLHDRNR